MSRRDVEDLKRRFDDPRGLCEALNLLDGRRGVEWLSCMNRDVKLRCLWHGDNTPSLSVSRGGDGTVRLKCFGCPITGDAFTLIAHVNGLDVRRDFRDVIDLACDLVGVQRPERRTFDARPAPAPRIVRVMPPPLVQVEPDDGALASVAAVLGQVAPVTESREAMDYLRSRGLAESDAARWYALPVGAKRDEIVSAIVEAIGPDAWRRTGLASESGWWASSWHGPRLVIPWRDPVGEVTCLQGRYIGDGAKAQRFAFPMGRAPLWPYGCDALARVGPDTAVAVVEGASDAESFNVLARRAGADAVALALPSVSAWLPEWFGLFTGRACIAALDNDEAGQKWTPDLVARLRAVARDGAVSVRVPSVGKDWNDVLRSRIAVAPTKVGAGKAEAA